MSALAVRHAVEQAFGEAGIPIGTYTHPGGQKSPAVSVGDPAEGVTAEGLEVLVHPNPERQELVTFAYAGAVLRYPVRLINWDAAPDLLEQALGVLAERFWPFGADPILLPETSENPEQVTFALLFDPDTFQGELP